MLLQFQQFIQQQHLFPHGQQVLLAVSGGRDSVAMTHLVASSNIPFAIAHCNFNLRPGDCDRDEDFVRSLAASYGVECYVANFDTAHYASLNHLSIEEAARNLRYDFFLKLVEQHHFGAVATAHHRDDSIETFFINLLRGTGINGLRGIPLRNGIVVRPLLPFSRQQINDYVSQQHLSFVDDTSNFQPLFLRNRIRLQLLPLLRDIAPSFDTTMQNNINHLADAADICNDTVDTLSKRLLVPDGEGFCIDINSLLQLPHLDTILFCLLHPYGFSSTVTNEIVAALHAQSGKQFLSHSHIIVKDRDSLIIRPRNNTSDPTRQIVISSPDDSALRSLPITMNVVPYDGQPVKLDTSQAWFDYDLVRFPLTLRHWCNGDRFIPFGMKGSRLVSDLLSDNKINLHDKQNVLLLCDSDNTVLWVVGIRSANVATITPKTKTILQISTGSFYNNSDKMTF